MDLLPQLGAVLAVFAVLGLTLWWLRKRGAVQFAPKLPFGASKRSKTKLLERVDVLQLSPTHALSVVKMADRAILVGTSPAGFCLIESSPWKNLQSHIEAQT